jgi:hypothetical protein
MQQLNLVKPKNQEAFEKFHEENPHIYDLLVELAKEAKEAHACYGIGGLFEVLRWNKTVKTKDKSFKLNNNHRAHYARLIMEQEPDLKGFFNTRQQKDVCLL